MRIHILGGGIIGASTAYQLSLFGNKDIFVYEKDKMFSEASFARSCGGLRSQYFTKSNILMSNFSIDFIKNKTDIQFIPNGYLMLFGKDQSVDCDYSHHLQVCNEAKTVKLMPDELSIHHPYINTGDLYAGCITLDQTEGWIDPFSLHKWYKDKGQLNGVKWIYEDAICANHDEADVVVICTGCWSNTVGKHFDLDIPVVPHKHTVFQVKTNKPIIKNLPLVADLVTGIYLRPEGDMYIVGYDGNGNYSSRDLYPDYSSWEDVWMHLYHRFPEIFDEAKMIGAWSGYYDASTIDNNAIIDREGRYVFATGFTGRGLMHSPAVGLTLSELATDQNTTFDISSYKLNRSKNIEKYVI